MATDAQINANRENAQKSTGPRTPEGKAISSRNAVKPGTAGRRCTLYAGDSIEYAKLGQQYVLDLKPVGIFESSLVETIVDNQWQINRSRAAMEECLLGVTPEFEQLVRLEKRLENSTARAAAALRAQQKYRMAEEHYKAILEFEDDIRSPYKVGLHGHLHRLYGFVPEETDLFLYFQQMEEENVVKLQKFEDDLAAERAKKAAPAPPAEAVIG